MPNWVVAKFGGTSMASIDAMTKCAEVIKLRGANVVIVSATSGTTDQLIELTKLAKAGEFEEARDIIDEIETRHNTMLLKAKADKRAKQQLQYLMNELSTLVTGCSLIKECSPKAYDAIVSIGEMLSSTIFATLCDSLMERDIHWLDARNLVKTNAQHGKAKVDISRTNECCNNKITDSSLLYISQGFIGSDTNGNTTTLGRGGSDYSAALIAEALRASELQIWTDVPGLASTDPRICDNAQSIANLSIKEASEMATFGAKILHPSSLMPAVRHSIPVFVGSTFEPEHTGTTINTEVETRPTVRAVTSRNNQWLVVINNPEMLSASGFLQRIFAVFESFDISVDAITTSEISIAVTIDESEYPQGDSGQRFIAELQSHGTVRVEKDMALIAIVGNNLHATPGIGAKIFNALEGINVRMITQGASSHNFCLLVSETDSNKAVSVLHQHLIINAVT